MDVLFEAKVKAGIQNARRILRTERDGYVLQASEVSHTYGDKFCLVEWMTTAAVASMTRTLDLLGMSETAWQSAGRWARSGKRVTLGWRCEERCQHLREEKVEMEDPNKMVSEGVLGRKIVDKVVTTITYHYWTFSWHSRLVLVCGPEELVVTARSASAQVQTTSANPPYPLVVIRDSLNLDLSYFLLHEERGAFRINRDDPAICRTPSRNAEIEEALEAFRRVADWAQQVQTYLAETIFVVQRASSPDVHVAFEMINCDSIFVPVLPLMDSRKDEGRVLSREDLDAFVEESIATLKAKLLDFEKSFPSHERREWLVTTHEARLVCCLMHLRALVENHHDGVSYVERLLKLQLIAAIGKEVSTDDFQQYLVYHNDAFFRAEYASRPFCYAVRRPLHDPEGILSIEPDFFTTTAMESGRNFVIPISASAKVRCKGSLRIHGHVTSRFTSDPEPSASLYARARQFSSFIVLLGNMASQTLFEPTFGIVVSNLDELCLPLEMETIPSAGEFRAAVSSLSPEQQKFCSQFRSMQLSATLFTICVIQLKPNMERVLCLPEGALTKEISLVEHIQELLISYNVSPDLLAAPTLAQLRCNVEAIRELFQREKDAQLAEARRLAELARVEAEARERVRRDREALERRQLETRRVQMYNSINYKICVLGAGGVGKSSLVIQFTANHFVEEWDPTIEDSYRKQIVIDDEACLLEILDTANDDGTYQALRDQWIRDSELFVLVFSITDRRSFDEIAPLREQILRVKDKDRVPMIIVGNKCDLPDDRQVLTLEALDFAKACRASFKEASAKTRVNVEELFCDLVRMGRVQRSSGAAARKGGGQKKKGGGGFALPSFNIVGKIQEARREREIMKSATSSTSSSSSASSSSSSSSRWRGDDPVIELGDDDFCPSTRSVAPQSKSPQPVDTQTAPSNVASAPKAEKPEQEAHEASNDSGALTHITLDASSRNLGDVSALPSLIESTFDENEGESVGTVRPTIIKPGRDWRCARRPFMTPNLIVPEQWNTERQATERQKCFDLLDGLSRSGAFELSHCELHVVQAATHLFDESVMHTLVVDNINPISHMERAQVLMASVIHGISPEAILK